MESKGIRADLLFLKIIDGMIARANKNIVLLSNNSTTKKPTKP